LSQRPLTNRNGPFDTVFPISLPGLTRQSKRRLLGAAAFG
jgi:hypothetical protein